LKSLIRAAQFLDFAAERSVVGYTGLVFGSRSRRSWVFSHLRASEAIKAAERAFLIASKRN
jgi:hypothetical protein